MDDNKKGFFSRFIENSKLTPSEVRVNNSAINDLLAERAVRANNISAALLGKAPTGVPLAPNIESKKLAESGAEKLSKSQSAKRKLLDQALAMVNAGGQEDFSKKPIPQLDLKTSLFR